MYQETPLVGIETEVLSLNDGDVLLVTLPADYHPSMDVVERIREQMQRIAEKSGKRANVAVLTGGLTIDRLTANQVKDMYERVTRED